MAEANIKGSCASIPLHFFMVCTMMTLLIMLQCVIINFIYRSQSHRCISLRKICIFLFKGSIKTVWLFFPTCSVQLRLSPDPGCVSVTCYSAGSELSEN